MKTYRIVVDGTGTYYVQVRHFLRWKNVIWSATLNDMKQGLKRLKSEEEKTLVWAEGDKL